MPSILFVCTANICRSPMAGGIFRKMVKDLGEESDWQIGSAGTWGIVGVKAAEGTLMVMLKRGIDLREHRSRIVSYEIVRAADLILTMEKGQKEALRIEYPRLASRIYLLGEMAGKVIEIDDPIGGPLTAYETTAQEIEQILRDGFSRIRQFIPADDAVK